MRTLIEIIEDMLPKKPDWWYFFQRGSDDVKCFLFGHKFRYIQDVRGNFKGAYICKRCYRFKFLEGEEEFYHNWEMDRGPAARCHNHKKS